MPSLPRFQIGDSVRILRPPGCPEFPAINRDRLIGRVVEVDTSRLLPHYVVEYAGMRDRFAEFDLMAVRQA
jgi:hypothetical protein